MRTLRVGGQAYPLSRIRLARQRCRHALALAVQTGLAAAVGMVSRASSGTADTDGFFAAYGCSSSCVLAANAIRVTSCRPSPVPAMTAGSGRESPPMRSRWRRSRCRCSSSGCVAAGPIAWLLTGGGAASPATRPRTLFPGCCSRLHFSCSPAWLRAPSPRSTTTSRGRGVRARERRRARPHPRRVASDGVVALHGGWR